MITAGCDVGSLTAKAVILRDNKMISGEVQRVQARPEQSADMVMKAALDGAGISLDQVDYCIGTGYGRKKIPFIDDTVSEITCHGKGAQWLLPSVRTVIDIGGQDCKATRMDKDGKIVKFITNDKCASGTGRFLEVMAELLNVSLDDMGPMTSKSKDTFELSATCTVWVQSEVVYHINNRRAVEDIGAAINLAMANRMALLANRVGLEKDVVMTGGVAKNIGVKRELERLIGTKIKKIRKDPQLVGAIGAAVLAQERCLRGDHKAA